MRPPHRFRALSVSASLTIVCSVATAQQNNESFLPPPKVELRLSLAQGQTVTFEPLVARLSLENHDRTPLQVDLCEDGAPWAIVSMIGRRADEYAVYPQEIRRKGDPIMLPPGQTTSGEFLVVFGAPTGFAFGEPGSYGIQFAFQPDPAVLPVYSNEVEVRVVRDDLHNQAFVEALSVLAYEYYGLDPESVRRSEGEQVLIGYRLIRAILKDKHPEAVDPQAHEQEQKRAGLITALATLLKQYPRNFYAPYIARWLGSIELRAFERTASLTHCGEMQLTAGERRVNSHYVAALRYLSMAAERECWPRTLAPAQLAYLHILAHDWKKADAFIEKLRTDFAEFGGVRKADALAAELSRYRKKLSPRDGQ